MRKLMQYIWSLLCTEFRQDNFSNKCFCCGKRRQIAQETQTDVAPSWYTSVVPCKKPGPLL